MLWKTCGIPCEKTCELFNFTCFLTCFSHLFHRVWNHWDPVNRAFFTGSEPMKNPVKNPVNFTLWKYLWKTLWKTCEKPLNFHSVFHRVENVKTCEQGIFHRVRTCEKPSEIQRLPGAQLQAEFRFSTCTQSQLEPFYYYN